MVIITRSKSSGLNTSITAEVREYFDNLIKPLVTNKYLEELLYKLKKGILSKFEDKLSEQNLKIQELESKIHWQENAFRKLEIIAAVRACAFTVLNLKKVIAVTSWKR